MFRRTMIFLAVIFTSIIAIASAESDPFFQDGIASIEPVHAEIIVEQESIQPGQPFWVGVKLKLDDKWHAYWKNPGDAGMAPMIDWQLPEGFAAGEILWPTPQKYTLNEAVGFGYAEEVILLVEIKSSNHIHSEANLGANIRWVVCDDSSCLPGGAELKTSVSVNSKDPILNPAHNDTFARARKKIPHSHQEFIAKSHNNLITLNVESPNEVVEAFFFPEEMDRIDHTVDAVVSKVNGNDNYYHVILKEAENASKTAPLKGVIVLKTSQTDDAHLAFEINLPVSNQPSDELALNSEINGSTATNNMVQSHHFDGGFFFALCLAFTGGLLLNLMPCVLPVISFKVLSFVKMAGQSRSLIFKHGVAFSFGVLLSFWVLAGVLLGMQAYGHAVGWGFQLQEPLFVAILAAIILIFGLSMFGVFEIGAGLASKAGQAQVSNKSSGLAGSFFSGILATAVATPCTGPFLGTAVGFAVTLPAFLSMLIFTSLGLGMASPYLMLGAFPSLLKYLPKPGNWMITFKEIMGFVMIATVLWLIWVFGAQTDALAVFLLLSGFFFMAIACWIYGKWGAPVKKKKTRLISCGVAAPFLILGAYVLFFASTIPSYCLDDMQNQEVIAMAGKTQHRSKWEKFSPERVDELRKNGTPVFVDFTAKWCLICQANHLVLNVNEVDNRFNDLGVVRMKADWTKSDPVITEELKKYGRNSVPLYLLYRPNSDEPATILPQVLTPETVLEYLKELENAS